MWTRLSDDFYSRPEIERASLAAVGAYCRMLSYCGHQLTDGAIGEGAALYCAGGRKALVRELVDHGLLRENGSDGYHVPAYLGDGNPTRTGVEQRRERDAARKRQERGRR